MFGSGFWNGTQTGALLCLLNHQAAAFVELAE